MAVRLEVQNDAIRHDRARWHGLPDHLVRTAKIRERRAEALANGVRWLWTQAGRVVRRVLNRAAPERRPVANGEQSGVALGRASLADALRRDRERLARGLRLIRERYARSRRRRFAIDQLGMLDDRLLADIGLTRGQIELAVDGMLAPRDQTRPQPAETPLPAEERRYELTLAA